MQKKEDDKEELDFMFDEELEDAPLDICGRKNTFTDWYVVGITLTACYKVF